MNSTSDSQVLPPWVVRQWSATDLDAAVGDTSLLMTTDASGWPHVALLSAGEVLVETGGTVRLALWPKTTTSANLAREGKATLAFIGPDGAAYVRLQVVDEGTLPPNLRYFCTRVVQVRDDAVGYAELVSGVRFTLKRREETVERWSRTIADLRDAPCRPADGRG